MVELDPLWIDWPIARIRRDLDVDDGTVSRFVVQLEYDIAAVDIDPDQSDWRVVARFDHDATSGGGHDVASEGLHLDVYRDGERYARLHGFPDLPLGRAMRYCERYLRNHSDRLLARFEAWHAIDHP